MQHDEPLECRHGCSEVKPHQCKDREKAEGEVSDDVACCVAHLVRTGRGFVITDGVFLTNPEHCIDGERARCNKCRRTWVHICDEAEGCSWECTSKARAK